MPLPPGVAAGRFFAPRSALFLAGKHNPALRAEYVAVERAIGHTFRKDFALGDIQKAPDDGEEPGPIQDWTM